MESHDDFMDIALKLINRVPKTREEYLFVLKEWINQQPHIFKQLEMMVPDEFMDNIRKELDDDKETREKYLLVLKNWMNEQPHYVHKIDEVILMAILLGTKFNIERAKKKVDGLYTYRTLLPEVFSNRDPFCKEIQTIHSLSIGALIKPKTPLGRWVMARRLHPDEYKTTNVNHLLKWTSMMFEIAIKEHPEILVLGFDYVVWGDTFSPSHAMMWTPPMLKKMVRFLQDCCPLRLRSVVLVNAPPMMSAVAKLFKSLISTKLKSRVHIYKAGAPKLEHYYDSLPEEFGGTNKTMQDHVDFWKCKLESYKDWFDEQEKYKSDESLRPVKPRTFGEVFGMKRSFRNLCVD